MQEMPKRVQTISEPHLPEEEVNNELKNMRDKLICSNKKKLELFNGGLPFIDYKEKKSILCLKLEIYALLSSLQEEKVQGRLKSVLRGILKDMFEYIKNMKLPYSRYDVSLFRSFKIILVNSSLEFFFSEYFPFFYEFMHFYAEDFYFYAAKNEVVELLCKGVRDPQVFQALSTKRFIYALNSPNLNSIELLNLLISPTTLKYFRIQKIFYRLPFLDSKSKKSALSCCVKWYKFSTYRRAVDASIMQSIILAIRDCGEEGLILLGRVIEDDLPAQRYCKEISLLQNILSYDFSVEFVYCVYALVTSLEENRKELAKSKIMSKIFNIFKQKIISSEMDEMFIMILHVFRVMTRSVLFLRSDLLEYPIVEFLFLALDKLKELELEEGVPENGQSYPPTSIINPVHQSNPVYPSSTLHIPKKIPDYFPFSDKAEGVDYVTESILLVLVNLVMEYGNYKSKFISSQGVEKVLSYKEKFPKTVLLLFKNFLYDTTWHTKEAFIRQTKRDFFGFFFGFSECTKDFDMLEIIFNLLRNLVCDDSLEVIIFNFEDFLAPILRYLRLFAESPPEAGTIEEGVLLQILYTVGNLSANSDRFREIVLKEEYMESLKRVGRTREVQVALVWIIINLSWKDEGHKERVSKLNKFKFREYLQGIESSDPILNDKISTALENLTGSMRPCE